MLRGDAAEEVTTEQPQTQGEFNRAQQQLLEGELLQKTDLGYAYPGMYSKYMDDPGTIEIPEFPGSGQNVPVDVPTQTQTQTQTQTETAPVDTGPTTRELILQAEQLFLDNNVGLPYSRQDYGSDEDYLNALTGFIDSYIPPAVYDDEGFEEGFRSLVAPRTVS